MRLINFSIITLLFVTTSVIGQDSASVDPGEDFDIEALLGIINDYSNFEELEKAINDSASDVNNLDLDGDGEVDYVLIQEEADGDTHVAFLRVAMAEDEYQDVATIEMEKLSSTTASFQVVGDVALYGEDYIFEPGDDGIVDISESGVEQGGKGGYFNFDEAFLAVRVTICVGVYRPGYRVFISPYGFGRHPVAFRPWRRVHRSSFRRRSAHRHRNSYKKTTRRRSSHANSMQKKNRKTSSKAKTNNKSSAAKKSNTSSAAKTNNKSSTQQKNTNTKNKQQKSNTHKKGGSTGKKRR